MQGRIRKIRSGTDSAVDQSRLWIQEVQNDAFEQKHDQCFSHLKL